MDTQEGNKYQKNGVSKRKLFFLMLILFFCGGIKTTSFAGASSVGPKELEREEKALRTSYFLSSSQVSSISNAGAFDLLYHAYRIDPNHAVVNYELPVYYLVLGNTNLAVQTIQKAIKKDPENYWYYDRLATAQIYGNEKEKAIETYRMMHKKFPNKSEILEKELNLHLSMDNLSGAITCYEQLEALRGQSNEMIFDKCKLYTGAGMIDSALAEINKLIKRNPSVSYYKILKGGFLMERGRTDEAYSIYSEVKEKEPNNPYLYTAFSQYYQVKEDSVQYKQLIEELLLNKEVDANVKTNVILTYLKLQLQKEVEAENLTKPLEELIHQFPQKEELYMFYSLVLNHYGHVEKAEQQLQTAIQFAPTSYVIWKFLIDLEITNEKYTAAIQSINNALEYFPQEAELYFFQGVVYSQIDNTLEAIKAFQKSLQFMGANQKNETSSIYGFVGDCYQSLDQSAEAIEAYEKSLYYNPQNALVMNNYAYYLSIRGENLMRAEQLSGTSIKLSPNNPTFLDTYAWIYFKMEKYDLAKFYIEQAIEYDDGNNFEILEHYGDILFHSGEKQKAVEFWQKAKEAGATSKVLEIKIKQKKYIEDNGK